MELHLRSNKIELKHLLPFVPQVFQLLKVSLKKEQ